MKLSTVISNIITKGLRSIKVKTIGENIETASYVSSGNIDFNPVKNMKAIFAKTANSSEPVILGYVNKTIIDDLEEGEGAFFSTDNETPLAIIRARKNGNLELNGDNDNIMRYSIMKEEYDKTKEVLDAILSTLETPINEPGNGAPSAFQAEMIAAVGTKETGDISGCKVDNVLTNQ